MEISQVQAATAVIGTLVTVTGAVVTLYRQRRSDVHLERVEKLVSVLPDKDTDLTSEDGSLKEKYLWVEALYQFDRLTLPKPRWAVFGICLLSSGLLWVATFLLIGVAAFGGSFSLGPRIIAGELAIGTAMWAILLVSIADDNGSPYFSLGGRRLGYNSRHHTERISQLRRKYGIAGAADIQAEHQVMVRTRRRRRFMRWYVRVRRSTRFMRTCFPSKNRRARNLRINRSYLSSLDTWWADASESERGAWAVLVELESTELNDSEFGQLLAPTTVADNTKRSLVQKYVEIRYSAAQEAKCASRVPSGD